MPRPSLCPRYLAVHQSARFSDVPALPNLPPPPPHTSVSRRVGITGGTCFCHNITSARFIPVSYLWIQQEPPSRKACRCLAWHHWVPTSRAPLSGWQGGQAATTQVAFYQGCWTECSDWVLLFTSTGALLKSTLREKSAHAEQGVHFSICSKICDPLEEKMFFFMSFLWSYRSRTLLESKFSHLE